MRRDCDVGSYALGAICSGSAWLASLVRCWQQVVGPWLAAFGVDINARHLLYSGLRRLPGDDAVLLIPPPWPGSGPMGEYGRPVMSFPRCSPALTCCPKPSDRPSKLLSLGSTSTPPSSRPNSSFNRCCPAPTSPWTTASGRYPRPSPGSTSTPPSSRPNSSFTRCCPAPTSPWTTASGRYPRPSPGSTSTPPSSRPNSSFNRCCPAPTSPRTTASGRYPRPSHLARPARRHHRGRIRPSRAAVPHRPHPGRQPAGGIHGLHLARPARRHHRGPFVLRALLSAPTSPRTTASGRYPRPSPGSTSTLPLPKRNS